MVVRYGTVVTFFVNSGLGISSSNIRAKLLECRGDTHAQNFDVSARRTLQNAQRLVLNAVQVR